jgi:hypothetical protein
LGLISFYGAIPCHVMQSVGLPSSLGAEAIHHLTRSLGESTWVIRPYLFYCFVTPLATTRIVASPEPLFSLPDLVHHTKPAGCRYQFGGTVSIWKKGKICRSAASDLEIVVHGHPQVIVSIEGWRSLSVREFNCHSRSLINSSVGTKNHRTPLFGGAVKAGQRRICCSANGTNLLVGSDESSRSLSAWGFNCRSKKSISEIS